MPNVDYKNGGLLSDKKKSVKKSFGKKADNNADEENAPKRVKKTKFLSKHHKEQHDNIFSKKFKNNSLNIDKRKKKLSK